MDAARQHFETMEDTELINTAAFFAHEYTPSGLATLLAVARERGITDETIKAHRSACYPGIRFLVICQSCEVDFLLSEDDFVNGEHVCGSCGSRAPVNYMDFELPPPLLQMAGDLLSYGSLLGIWRKTKKQLDRRNAIIDGSYWQGLREFGEGQSDDGVEGGSS